MKLYISTCLVGILITLLPWDASACTMVIRCSHDLKVGKELPIQAEGVVWDLGIGTSSLDELRNFIVLQEFDGSRGTTLEVKVRALTGGEVLIVPEDGFQPDRTYQLSVTFPKELYAGVCYYERTITRTFGVNRFTTIPPLHLAARELQREPYVFIAPASCSIEEEAVYADVSIQWPYQLQDARDSLDVEVLLDGEVTDIPVRASTFTLASTCEDASVAVDSRAEGDYHVVARARVPGTSTYWDSEPLMVPLYCNEGRGCACSTSPPQKIPLTPFLLLVFGVYLRCFAAPRDRTTR